MVRRVSQSKYKPKICQTVYRLGFASEPTGDDQSSSSIESEGILLCTFLTEPIVVSSIPGRPQSVNLAEGGQAVCRFDLAPATTINHRLSLIEGDKLASLPFQLTFLRMFLL